MQAVVVERPGDTTVLSVRSVPDPRVRGRECLIRVMACGVTAHDIAVRNGTLRRGVVMPVILGQEIAGVVEAVGEEVTEWRVGDDVVSTQRRRVCGSCRLCRTGRETLCVGQEFLGDVGMNGGYAQFVIVEQDNLAAKPHDVSFAHACVVASAIGTELNALRDVARVGVGESVLVTGAGGGLGIHGIQVARALGARTLAVTSSARKAEFLSTLGTEVIVTERDQDFSELVKQATGGEGVDVVIDNVGTPIFTSARRSLARGGRWVLVGQLSGEFVPFNPAQLFLRGISMLSALSTSREQLRDALALVERGAVVPIVTEEFELEDVARAHAVLEAGESLGRVVVLPQH